MPGVLVAPRPAGPAWLPWGPACLWPARLCLGCDQDSSQRCSPTAFPRGGSLVSVLPPQAPSPLLTSLEALLPRSQAPSLGRSLRTAFSGGLAQPSPSENCSIAWSSRDPACCPRTSLRHLLPPGLACPHLPAQGGWVRGPGWLQASTPLPAPLGRICPWVGLGCERGAGPPGSLGRASPWMDRGQACLLGLGVPGRLKPGLVSPTSKAARRWLQSLRCQACQDLFSREEGDGLPAPVLARGWGRAHPGSRGPRPGRRPCPGTCSQNGLGQRLASLLTWTCCLLTGHEAQLTHVSLSFLSVCNCVRWW